MNTAELKKLAEAATPYEGYTVDEDGNVWSSSNWRGLGKRVLSSHPNSHGYPSVKVKSGGKMKKALVHVMVCTAFHGERPSTSHQVRHLNGVRSDCRSSNLAWGTPAENARDRKVHGTERAADNGRRGMNATQEKLRNMRANGLINYAFGERAGSATTTKEVALAIKSDLSLGIKQRSIAKKHGVTEYVVSQIKHGKSWRNV